MLFCRAGGEVQTALVIVVDAVAAAGRAEVGTVDRVDEVGVAPILRMRRQPVDQRRADARGIRLGESHVAHPRKVTAHKAETAISDRFGKLFDMHGSKSFHSHFAGVHDVVGVELRFDAFQDRHRASVEVFHVAAEFQADAVVLVDKVK